MLAIPGPLPGVIWESIRGLVPVPVLAVLAFALIIGLGVVMDREYGPGDKGTVWPDAR